MALVPIIMGSKSDLKIGQAVADALGALGVKSEIRVASAHKAPLYVLDILTAYEADPQPKVYVTIAGRSNALSAFVDAAVPTPVIACPPYSDKFGGGDLYSSLRMPGGVAPMVVLDPKGAALSAAKILALQNPALKKRIQAAQAAAEAKIRADDQGLQGD